MAFYLCISHVNKTFLEMRDKTWDFCFHLTMYCLESPASAPSTVSRAMKHLSRSGLGSSSARNLDQAMLARRCTHDVTTDLVSRLAPAGSTTLSHCQVLVRGAGSLQRLSSSTAE